MNSILFLFVLGFVLFVMYYSPCERETMFRHHKRVLSKCPDGNGTFVGEKHHKLWWDEHQEYWYCGRILLKFHSLILGNFHYLYFSIPT